MSKADTISFAKGSKDDSSVKFPLRVVNSLNASSIPCAKLLTVTNLSGDESVLLNSHFLHTMRSLKGSRDDAFLSNPTSEDVNGTLHIKGMPKNCNSGRGLWNSRLAARRWNARQAPSQAGAGGGIKNNRVSETAYSHLFAPVASPMGAHLISPIGLGETHFSFFDAANDLFNIEQESGTVRSVDSTTVPQSSPGAENERIGNNPTTIEQSRPRQHTESALTNGSVSRSEYPSPLSLMGNQSSASIEKTDSVDGSHLGFTPTNQSKSGPMTPMDIDCSSILTDDYCPSDFVRTEQKESKKSSAANLRAGSLRGIQALAMRGNRRRQNVINKQQSSDLHKDEKISHVSDAYNVSPKSHPHTNHKCALESASLGAAGGQSILGLSGDRNSNKNHLGGVPLPGQSLPNEYTEAVSKGESDKFESSRAVPQLGSGYGVFMGKWERKNLLGRGQFGSVFEARDIDQNKRIAVKVMEVHDPSLLKLMVQEVQLMCRASFRNINVVSCLGWSVEGENVVGGECSSETTRNLEKILKSKADIDVLAGPTIRRFNIFMEFVEKGSIASLLQRHGPLNEIMVRNFTRQLLHGLRSLHAAGIAHRDIKCQNLLLTGDNVLKLADFGCAKRVARVENETMPQGSVPWMSPEVIRGEVGGSLGADVQGWKRADVWSIGCTIVEMATGKPPWKNYSNPAAAMYAIATCSKVPILPDSLHADGHDFLELCFSLDPVQRPSVAKLIYHNYMHLDNVDMHGRYRRVESSDTSFWIEEFYK